MAKKFSGFLSRVRPSFRDGPKDQTRNLEIPGSMLTHRPGMTVERYHALNQPWASPVKE
jgi:hypothetical protein